MKTTLMLILFICPLILSKYVKGQIPLAIPKPYIVNYYSDNWKSNSLNGKIRTIKYSYGTSDKNVEFGEKVLSIDTNYFWVDSFDIHGHIIKKYEFKNNNRTLIETIQYTLNKNGLITEEYHNYKDGEKTHKLYNYNNAGDLEKITFYGNGNEFYGHTILKYNKAHQIVMKFDSSVTGVATTEYIYINKRKIEERYFSPTGEKNIIVYSYDEKGNKIFEEHLELNKKLVFKYNKFEDIQLLNIRDLNNSLLTSYEFKYEYDKNGNWINLLQQGSNDYHDNNANREFHLIIRQIEYY